MQTEYVEVDPFNHVNDSVFKVVMHTLVCECVGFKIFALFIPLEKGGYIYENIDSKMF